MCRAAKQQVWRGNVLVFKKQNAPGDGKGKKLCYSLPELQMHLWARENWTKFVTESHSSPQFAPGEQSPCSMSSWQSTE